MIQYFGPLLDIYLDTQKEQRLDLQKDKMIVDLMVFLFRAVLVRYL